MKIKKKLTTSNKMLLLAALLGIAAGFSNISYIHVLASEISHIFMNLLSLISIPIIFFSIVSTISSIENIDEMKILGRKVIKYTLLTTIIACTVAVFIFSLINPAEQTLNFVTDINKAGNVSSALSFLSNIIPPNMVKAFTNNKNVLSVVFIAIILSLAILSLPKKKKNFLTLFFSSMYDAILIITNFIVYLMPIGIWAFVTMFTRDIQANTGSLKELLLYTISVLLTETIQGTVILPILLKIKKIPPIKTFKGVYPAVAFGAVSRSSSGTLPLTIQCAEKNLNVSSRVANFSLPICATINMNGCAVFMLTTILYVTTINGMAFSLYDIILWIAVSTLGAIGNASVPMSCYFMTSAFIASMNVPLHILGVILPIYSILDMMATALNVWSDSVVTKIIDKELKDSGSNIPDNNNDKSQEKSKPKNQINQEKSNDSESELA